MTPEQYEIARRLIAIDPRRDRWMGCRFERHAPDIAPHGVCMDRYGAPISEGYAPDIAHPWAVGILLAWMLELRPSGSRMRWYAYGAAGRYSVGDRHPECAAGVALALAILDVMKTTR